MEMTNLTVEHGEFLGNHRSEPDALGLIRRDVYPCRVSVNFLTRALPTETDMDAALVEMRTFLATMLR